MEIIVPQPKELPDGTLDVWPTLGPQVCDFLEERFVYGPGPLKGEPYKVRDDLRYIIYRAYEHYPDGYKEFGEDRTGRRRFTEVNISLPKGSAKCLSPETELVLESGERVRADEIRAGDRILSWKDGKPVYRAVVAAEEQPEAMTYRVKTDHGRSIVVSEGHPFLVSGTQWVEVESLEQGDQLTSVEVDQQIAHVSPDFVSGIEPLGLGITIGIEVEDTHVHVTNGLVTHNTELMALISLVELHPDAPIRFNGYDPDAPGGMAPGRSVMSPFIPLLAPTKDQLHDLAYGACYAIVNEIEDAGMFDATMQRILINGESESKIIPVAANASRLDGLKPTFQGIDEPHRLYEDRQRASYATMVNNLPKRAIDDPWQLTTTTAGDPNEPSIARDQYRDGVAAFEGRKTLDNTFFYHRQTSDANARFDTMENRLIALREASGPEVSEMRDLFSTAAKWDKEGEDVTYLERVWCNRWTQSSKTAFDAEAFKALGDRSLTIAPGSSVTLGFDGAQTQDSTALVMTEIESGVQNLIGLWERPPEAERWQVPVSEVDAMVEMCFNDYDVWHLYADPPYWQEYVSKWSGQWEGKVVEWHTRNTNNMYYAIRSFMEAIDSGEMGHNGNPDYERHIANAGRNNLGVFDDEGKEKFRLTKLSRDRKFDAAMAGILSWQARLDALKKGAELSGGKQVPRRLR